MFLKEPDISGFVEKTNMKIQLVTYWFSDNISSLSITNDGYKNKYDFDNSKLKTYSFDLGNINEFNFSSSNINDKRFVTLLLPDCWQVVIWPQSSVSISRNSNTIEARVNQWNLWFFESPYWQDFFKISVYSGSNEKLTQDQTLQIENNIKNYEEDLKEYLLDQVGWVWVELKTTRLFMKTFLNIMFSFDSESYSQNLLNYQSFDKYFELENDDYEIVGRKVLSEWFWEDINKAFNKLRFWEKMSDK